MECTALRVNGHKATVSIELYLLRFPQLHDARRPEALLSGPDIPILPFDFEGAYLA